MFDEDYLLDEYYKREEEFLKRQIDLIKEKELKMKIKKADVVELLEDVGNTVHYFKKGDIGVVIDDDYDSCLEVSFKEGKLIAEKDVFKRIKNPFLTDNLVRRKVKWVP